MVIVSQIQPAYLFVFHVTDPLVDRDTITKGILGIMILVYSALILDITDFVVEHRRLSRKSGRG